MDFGILCKHFGTVTQCLVDLTAKPLETSQEPKKSTWPIQSASKMILFDFLRQLCGQQKWHCGIDQTLSYSAKVFT